MSYWPEGMGWRDYADECEACGGPDDHVAGGEGCPEEERDVMELRIRVDNAEHDGVLRFDRFVHYTGEEKFQVTTVGVPWLSRGEMHELHRALGETLGLGSPAPTSPLTAGRAASHDGRAV